MSLSREEIQRQRVLYNKAKAIVSRARNAGIPEDYLRIMPDKCISFLDDHFYKDKKEVIDKIYNFPDKFLFFRDFILIDGGNFMIRKQMGFALLFRMIACDYFGLYKDCSDLVHKLQTIRSTADENRNDLANYLKQQDILFISEFHEGLFNKHFDSGTLFDEILSFRQDNRKPTIISFSNPLNSKNKIQSNDCGMYLRDISNYYTSEFVDNGVSKILHLKTKA
jgi:hypothetical protein